MKNGKEPIVKDSNACKIDVGTEMNKRLAGNPGPVVKGGYS